MDRLKPTSEDLYKERWQRLHKLILGMRKDAVEGIIDRRIHTHPLASIKVLDDVLTLIDAVSRLLPDENMDEI